MSRRKAREYAFMFLYQSEMRNTAADEHLTFFLENYPLEKEDIPYFELLCRGVLSQKDNLDAIYEPYLKGWKIQRLPKVDVIILRIATFEITQAGDVPKSVSINEAVIIAKKFSTEDSKAYINGVLGKIPEGQKP